MKFLIFGLGSIGCRHGRIIQELGAHEIFACRSRKQTPPCLGGLRLAGEDYEPDAALAKGPWDGILITNPTSRHVDTALAAAGLGVPLLIEKPLGSNRDGLEELTAVAARTGAKVLMGYNMRYHRGVQRVSCLLRNAELGPPAYAHAHFGTYLPDWHPWEDYRTSYAARRDLGGGVVLTSVHEMNFLCHWLGDARVESATAVDPGWLDVDVESGVTFGMKHRAGATSMVYLSLYERPARRYSEVVCREGSLHLDLSRTVLRVARPDGSIEEKLGNGLDATELIEESYRRQMEHFIDICGGRAEPLVPLHEGVRDVERALDILGRIA